MVDLHLLRTDQTNITVNVNSNGHPFQQLLCLHGFILFISNANAKQGDEDTWFVWGYLAKIGLAIKFNLVKRWSFQYQLLYMLLSIRLFKYYNQTECVTVLQTLPLLYIYARMWGETYKYINWYIYSREFTNTTE